MIIVYVAREKPRLDRAPTLQILHTLRGLSLAGGRARYVTPWPAGRVRRTFKALTGYSAPDDLEIVTLGSGPSLPLISRFWPAPSWRGIRSRLKRYLGALRKSEEDVVVYTRNRRV